MELLPEQSADGVSAKGVKYREVAKAVGDQDVGHVWVVEACLCDVPEVVGERAMYGGGHGLAQACEVLRGE